MDLDPKTKQPFWETPRNVAILLAAASAIGGWMGFDLGRQPAPPQVVIYMPGAAPAAVPAAPAK